MSNQSMYELNHSPEMSKMKLYKYQCSACPSKCITIIHARTEPEPPICSYGAFDYLFIRVIDVARDELPLHLTNVLNFSVFDTSKEFKREDDEFRRYHDSIKYLRELIKCSQC